MEAEMGSFLVDGNNELSFFNCFDEEGDIDVMKYMMYCKLEEVEEEKLLFEVFVDSDLVEDTSEDSPKQRRSQNGESGKKHSKRSSLFGKMYIKNPKPGNKKWRGEDATWKSSSSIELLVLGLLHYLGRGLTFDNLEEYTAILEEDSEELSSHTNEYTMADFAGASWSTDATHVHMENCCARLRNLHLGPKEKWP
eukprot:1413755-Ditylum_brightwellii.AAC.1